MPKQALNIDKDIVDAIRDLMNENPDGVLFGQIYERICEKSEEDGAETPSSERVFRRLEWLTGYDELVVTMPSGDRYKTHDLDEYAVLLEISELLAPHAT